MLKYGNKEIRNLQEQVLKNMDDISNIKGGSMVLDEFGIKVIDQVATQAEFEEKWDITSEAFDELEYGDAVAVGTAAPYKLHIKTRANDSHPADYWFYIGQFPEPGPKGDDGEKGDKGNTGNTGPQGPQGERGYGITNVVVTQDEDKGTYILYEMTFTYGDGHTSTATFKAYKGEDGESPDYTAGAGIQIATSGTGEKFISAKVDGTTITTDAQARLTVIGGTGGKEYYAGNGIALEGADDDTITVLADSDEFTFGETDGELKIGEISADKIIADNTQSVQANLERIDGEIEDVIDDVEAIKEDYITSTALDEALEAKQDVLTAGANITILNNVISASGGSELTPEALAEVLEGSATVTVDINETDDKVQVKLDQDVIDEIDGKADTEDLSEVAFSGDYDDLTNTPTIPSLDGYATEEWVEDQGYLTEHQSLAAYRTSAAQDVIDATHATKTELAAVEAEIPSIVGLASETYVDNAVDALDDTLSTVAKTGSYTSLSNKPTIPDGALADLDSIDYTSNYITNKPTIPTVPTNVSAFTNDAGYITSIPQTLRVNRLNFNDAGTVFINKNNDDEIVVSELTTPRINADTAHIEDLYINSDGAIHQGNTSLDIGNTSGTIAVTSEIPTATSDLTNDSGFITSSYHDNTKQDTLTAGTNIHISDTNVISAVVPTNYVTTNTYQEVSGQKKFTEALGTIFSKNSSNYVTVFGDKVTKTASGTAYDYTLPNKAGTLAMTSDIPSTSNFVTTDTVQTISGRKTFSDYLKINYDQDDYYGIELHDTDENRTLNIQLAPDVTGSSQVCNLRGGTMATLDDITAAIGNAIGGSY